MLKAEGDLGQSLFAASTGMSGVRRVLDDLAAEADGLFRPRAHNLVINQALRGLAVGRRIVREKSVPEVAWHSLSEELAGLEEQRQEVQEESEDLTRRISRHERLRKALPGVAERAHVLRKLAELGEVRPLPDGF